MSQEELLTHVWDANADPFTSTVRVTVGTLRRKLEAARPDEPGPLETIIGQGYRLRDTGMTATRASIGLASRLPAVGGVDPGPAHRALRRAGVRPLGDGDRRGVPGAAPVAL